MVVMALLSLIVIALMGVFNSTQAAFRASVTQTDVLEGGRAAMDLITTDLRAMTAADGVSNTLAVNFYAGVSTAQPLVQPLVGSAYSRGYVLETVFLLSRQNQTWTGVGYHVDTASAGPLNPLYRFSMSTNVSALNGPAMIYRAFSQDVYNVTFTNSPPWSRLMEGVMGFRARAYDPNGVWLTNGYASLPVVPVKNAAFFGPMYGEVGVFMYSNALPASVEVELATLEDHVLSRAGTWVNGSAGQSNYLAQQAGKVHIFRQRANIPNVDPSVYQ